VLVPLPRYDDPRFVSEVKKLVRQLSAHDDGNPTTSYVRICAGTAGEDNPSGEPTVLVSACSAIPSL
jgi:hypothetical protein